MLRCLIWVQSTLFAQACLSEYIWLYCINEDTDQIVQNVLKVAYLNLCGVHAGDLLTLLMLNKLKCHAHF